MAFKIVWSELARQDLRDIVEFIARDNPQIAESFGYSLITKVDSLV
jgi:plasmid stabilization system protein ParE